MCGFFGVLNYKALNKELFRSSLNTLRHRGPDKSDLYTDSKVCFGFNRLSIRDLSSNGNQPMHSRIKSTSIMFNGEVYNYDYLLNLLRKKNVKVISDSDTEVVLEIFNIYGIKKTLDLIEGMFALVIYDKKLQKVFFARDKFGQKPFFFQLDNDGFFFSSEIKAIIKYKGNAYLDKANILNPIFTTGLPPKSKTCFGNINSLNPGEFMEYCLDTNEYDVQKYFEVNKLVDKDLYNDLNNSSTRNLVHKYNEILHESVKLHLQSDAPLASMFSLGLDSTLISTIASQYTNIDLYNFRGDLDNTDKFLKDYQKKFDTNIVRINENPTQSISDLPKMVYHYETPNKEEGAALSKLCSKSFENGIKVLLTGDAADELFGGYGHHASFLGKMSNFNSKTKSKLFRGVRHFFPNSIFNMPEYNPLGTDYNTNPAIRTLDEAPLNLLYHHGERLKEWNDRIQCYDFISNHTERAVCAYLLDEIGYKLERFMIRGDRYGMMSSVELRNPFLYTPLVKLAVNTPIKYKIKRNLFGQFDSKYILKEVAKLNGVPNSIIYRRKIGTPINSKKQINKILKKINLKATSELLNVSQENIKYSLFNSYDPSISRLIYSFLSVEILYQIYIAGRDHASIGDEFEGYLK